MFPCERAIRRLVLLVTLTMLASVVASDSVTISFDSKGKRTVTTTDPQLEGWEGPEPRSEAEEAFYLGEERAREHANRRKKHKKKTQGEEGKKKKRSEEDKKKKKSDQATPEATLTSGPPPQPTAAPTVTCIPLWQCRLKLDGTCDLTVAANGEGGTRELLLTRDAIIWVFLPILLIAVLFADISARMAPSLNHKNQVDLQRPLLEHRTFWSYFCSQHLWLGVLHPCRPQCRVHHTSLLVFHLSWHGVLAALMWNLPDMNMLYGVLFSLAGGLFARFVIEDGSGEPISRNASLANFRKLLYSKSEILESFLDKDELPPTPKYMVSLSPFRVLYLVVLPICVCTGVTKNILDANLVTMSTNLATRDPGVWGEAIEKRIMAGWWHHLVVALVLDAIVVQSIVSACRVFLESVTVTGYPHCASLLGSPETVSEKQALLLNMELSHPLVLEGAPQVRILDPWLILLKV